MYLEDIYVFVHQLLLEEIVKYKKEVVRQNGVVFTYFSSNYNMSSNQALVRGWKRLWYTVLALF